MKIDIIIPCYKARKTLSRLLSSIAIQSVVNDITVTIVNDFDNEGYSDIISLYQNLDIHYLQLKENKGSGVARQHGLDHTSGDYVVFADADDCFASTFALELLRQELIEHEADMVNGAFERNFIIDDKTKVVPTEQSITWMHGKMFKREFLVKNNICFHPTLRLNEDVYFNQLFYCYEPKVVNLRKIVYSWIDTEGSLTNTHKYKVLSDFVNACKEFNKEVIARGIENVVSLSMIVDNFLTIWAYYNEVSDNFFDLLNDYVDVCKSYRTTLKHFDNKLDDDLINYRYSIVMKNDNFRNRIADITVKDFLKLISD